MANEITPQVARAIAQAGPDDLMNMNQDVINTKAIVDSVNEEMSMLLSSMDHLNNSLNVYDQRKRICRKKMHEIAMRLA